MTREEAIEILENGGWWDLFIPITTIEGRSDEDKLHQAIDMAISALRSVSREQVENSINAEMEQLVTEMREVGELPAPRKDSMNNLLRYRRLRDDILEKFLEAYDAGYRLEKEALKDGKEN